LSNTYYVSIRTNVPDVLDTSHLTCFLPCTPIAHHYSKRFMGAGLKNWDTSALANGLDYTFYQNSEMNGDFTSWDVSKVTSMTKTFGGDTMKFTVSEPPPLFSLQPVPLPYHRCCCTTPSLTCLFPHSALTGYRGC
jgi:hypothetical protein